MEELITLKFKNGEIGVYQGHKVFVRYNVAKEWIATIGEDGSIEINPDAYKILEDKPDYLERIYEHEIRSGANHDPHECPDKDILHYLKNKGYNFGTFQFE